jgi:hypothetical protein
MSSQKESHRQHSLTRREFVLGATSLAVAASAGCKTKPEPPALSSTERQTLDAALDAPVANGELAGLVAMVSRGDAEHVHVAGVQDLQDRAPMRRDTIFRRFGWFGGYGTVSYVHFARGCVATLFFQRVMSSPDDTAITDDYLRRAFRAAET